MFIVHQFFFNIFYTSTSSSTSTYQSNRGNYILYYVIDNFCLVLLAFSIGVLLFVHFDLSFFDYPIQNFLGQKFRFPIHFTIIATPGLFWDRVGQFYRFKQSKTKIFPLQLPNFLSFGSGFRSFY